MPKILILVLSAQRQPWNAMLRKQRDTWDSIGNEATETIFYIGGNNQTRFDDRTLFSQTDEHLHNIGRRTVEALEFALTRQWDFMARVHSSTYVHKRRLVTFIDSLPRTDVLYGLQTPGPLNCDYLWGGGHYVMTRGVCEKLVAHKEEWDHAQMEDVAMSKLAAELGIPYGRGRSTGIDWKPGLASASCMVYNGAKEGFNFTDFRQIDTLDDQFFFRCKHDPDRAVDLKTFDLLQQNLTH